MVAKTLSSSSLFRLLELDRLKELDGIHIIGHVTSPGQGCYLVTPDGAELRLRAQGWPDEAEK